MSLVRVMKGAVSRASAPESSDTGIASSALSLSASNIRAIAQGGKKNAQIIKSVTEPVRTGSLTQSQGATLATKLGAVSREAAALSAAKPVILAAVKDWEKSEIDRAQIAKAVGGASAKVAKLNAETQRTLFNQHREAQVLTQYHQSAYGGAELVV